MPEYNGTLPELIASHVGPLPEESQKEGVWEDTRMLSVELVGGTAPVGPEMLSSDPPRGFLALLDAFPDSYREKWGLGGYADAKVRFRGLFLKSRAWG